MVEISEEAGNLAGYGGGGVDDAYLGTNDLLDEGDNEGVMGAAQDYCVDAPFKHGQEGRFQDEARLRSIQVTCFDQFHQAGASVLENSDALGEALDHRGIQLALEGGGGGQDPHYAGLSCLGSRFDSRLHADEGDGGKDLAEMMQGGCRSRITGDDNQAGTLVEKVASDAFGEAAHLFGRAGAIGDVGLVSQVENV